MFESLDEGGEPIFTSRGETRRTRCSNTIESGFLPSWQTCLTLSSAERRRFTVTDRRDHHWRARV